jgi:cobalt transporter subunit CbtB
MLLTSGTVKKVESQVQPAAWTGKILPALFAATLGLALLWVAGFAELSPLHGAAHDVRHSAAFPCH